MASNVQTIPFTVLLQAPSVKTTWEVEVWHSTGVSSDWACLRLDTNDDHVSQLLSGRTAGTWYTGILNIDSISIGMPLYFTLRFRAPQEDWEWAKDHSGIEDGRIILQTQAPYGDIKDHIADFNSAELTATQVASDAPDTSLWLVTAPVASAQGDESGWSRYRLGTPRSVSRWFALVRHTTSWLGPRHGRS